MRNLIVMLVSMVGCLLAPTMNFANSEEIPEPVPIQSSLAAQEPIPLQGESQHETDITVWVRKHFTPPLYSIIQYFIL